MNEMSCPPGPPNMEEGPPEGPFKCVGDPPVVALILLAGQLDIYIDSGDAVSFDAYKIALVRVPAESVEKCGSLLASSSRNTSTTRGHRRRQHLTRNAHEKSKRHDPGRKPWHVQRR